jgi:hypothetical protein
MKLIILITVIHESIKMKHLVIIQNGLNGWYKSMNPMRNVLDKSLDQNFMIIVSDVNDFHKTWDGIEKCGERLAVFTIEHCEKHKPDKISFIGHSLGGLIIRNCIGHLERINFFNKIQPISYVSVASPHLGIFTTPYYKQVIVRMGVVGMTGKELLIEDESKLLVEMSQEEGKYYQGLNRFKNLLTYGNIKGDASVGFETSCITYPIKSNKKYSLGELININPNIDCDLPENYTYPYPDKLYFNLSKLCWIRKAIDISNYCSVHTAIVNNGYGKLTTVIDDIAVYLNNE